MLKSLDKKLAAIHADAHSKAFILADAKDADMAFGIAGPGRSPERPDGPMRSLAEYREQIRANVRQGLIDIMLMSVSTSEALTIKGRVFRESAVTPAIRANDTTDIHLARGGAYGGQPALPFRTALLDHAQAGRIDPEPSGRRLGADLGLYSLTFNNDAELDRRALEAYREFRVEAERKGFRHFLEVFDPNAPAKPLPPEQVGGFINDQIVRALAGVPQAARPIFLKIVYHGPKFMEELAHYDRHLVPGILGGASGTTYDAFKLLDEAKRHGARAALFGRRINNAEHQLSFIQFLRWVADGQASPEEAVRAYHGVLEGLKIRPLRPLDEDMRLTHPAVGRSVSAVTVSIPTARVTSGSPRGLGANDDEAASGTAIAGRPAEPWPTRPDGAPDFARMTPQQRLAYHKARLDRAIDGKKSAGREDA